MHSNKLTKSEKSMIVVSIVLIGLAVSYGIWDHWSNLPPLVNIPAEKLPDPNGFDYYMIAARHMADVDKFFWAMSPPAPPAAPPSAQPPMPAPPAPGVPQPPSPVSLTPKPAATPADRAKLLKKHEADLAAVRAGMQYDYCRPRSYDLCPTPIGWICNLFSLEATVMSERKDWSAAVDSCVERIEVGYDLANDGSCVPAMAGEREWKLLPHLDQATCRHATLRMQKILASAATYAESERSSKIDTQIALLKDLENPNWRNTMVSYVDLGDSQDHTREKLYYKTASKRRIMADWTASMDEAIRIAEMPYPRMPQDLSYLSRHCALFYYHDLFRDRTDWEISSATNRLFTVALALRAYRLEHGAYPAALSSLTPEYLANLPLDPFTVKSTFAYRLKGNGYMLYSLGRNCQDDGGQPNWVNLNSDDIVAGAVRPEPPKVSYSPAGAQPPMPPGP